MQNKIEKLSDYYIVCGFGRMGNHICTDLKNAGVPFVVIENNPDNQKKLDETDYLYDTGDASRNSTLLRMGVKKAKGLVAVLSSDAENVLLLFQQNH